MGKACANGFAHWFQAAHEADGSQEVYQLVSVTCSVWVTEFGWQVLVPSIKHWEWNKVMFAADIYPCLNSNPVASITHLEMEHRAYGVNPRPRN